ncbi:MAG: aspartate aminotransferase family protein [Bacteroidota bacterium]
MISQRQLFLQHVAQTSEIPMMLEIKDASGIYLTGIDGNKYLDLISGIAVNNLGHNHPVIIKAIKEQVDKHMHVMVYGEFIQSPQVNLAQKLNDLLPSQLSSTYFVNSGSEAVEGAVKLAKRYTGKNKIVAFKNGYHGSTHGALSLMSNEEFKRPFRPLLPGVDFLDFNDINQLPSIEDNTAAVIIEIIQGEAGIKIPSNNFLLELQETCRKKNILLIVDESQTAFGRTGNMFAFEETPIIPDILVLSKSLGGGMPLGAFISSAEIMSVLSKKPPLGHITTFGGHPLSCAASLAGLNYLLKNEYILKEVKQKGEIIKKVLHHPKIKEIRGKGLFLAVEFSNFEEIQRIIKIAIRNGIITDWFLFCNHAIRIAPPLIVTMEEVQEFCDKLNEIFELAL